MTTPYRLARRTVGKALRAIPWTRRQMMASCDYEIVTPEEARRRQSKGWDRRRTVSRQDLAYRKLLAAMHAGDARVDLRVAADAVDSVGLPQLSVLEIGCGSGYYCEVLNTLAKSTVDYTGIDYSAAMIARAKSRYPSENFSVGDATTLQFEDEVFDVTFNGVSLMHILAYEKAIAESARVAKRAAIFHSVPIMDSHRTVHLHKYAYGSPVVEVVFNRDELLALFSQSGLELVHSWASIDYDVSHVTGTRSHAETFYCKKRGQAR